MSITFGQFSGANRVRCESSEGFNHPLNGWSSSDWMTAILGELGESVADAAVEVFNSKSAEIGYPVKL